MILVADSGSSKTDWILTSKNNDTIRFSTSGINPFFLTEKEIVKIFYNTKEIQPYFKGVKEIYFFGAGCSSPDRREVVSNALSVVFKNAYINIDQDSIGALYATCGNKEGLCCILGTGSNISYFDGFKVHTGKHGLGFILGDEGSGSYFGKQLITDFLYGIMPLDVRKKFYQTYKVNKETVIQNVYQKPGANKYLAGFARFLSTVQDHPYTLNLLRTGFKKYIETNILSYPNYRTFPCHFVGSIAFYFQDILKLACKEHHVIMGKVLKQPIEELSDFIIEREQKG
jgi:N-acetylglucosamine kinase-like BadF-type ATPase